MKLIFLDTETTGNDVSKDRLCQICYKTRKNEGSDKVPSGASGPISDQTTDQTTGEMVVEYFKPPLPISVKAMSVTHITNKMVENKPPFEGSETKVNLQKLLDTGVLIAHNCKFDCAILENEGMNIPHKICTLRVARYLDSKGIIPEYNLQYLRYYLDLDIEGHAHDAEGDVNVLEGVFDRLLAKMKAGIGAGIDGGKMSENEAIEKMIDISSKPSLYRQFNFGKYKDKTLEEVAKTDRGYLEWLLKQKLTAEDNDEDWIYTLQHYLGA